MTSRTYDPNNKEEVFNELRRRILNARLQVALDSQAKRESSQTLIKLSKMKLPPIEGTVRGKRTNDPSNRGQVSDTKQESSELEQLETTLGEIMSLLQQP